jgi:hypothetical protein
MSVYPIYLVLGSDGIQYAYADETLLKISLTEYLKDGDPARQVYKLVDAQRSLVVSYEPAPEYAEFCVPLENLCARHTKEALRQKQQKAAGA